MKFIAIAAAAAALAQVAPAAARPGAAPLKLERVVMVMRHGVRPPTKAQPIPLSYSKDKWPAWDVAPGLLTQRGAAGVRLLGASDRALYTARGLLGPGCPAPGAVVLHASNKQRAIRTAEEWGAAFLPGCAVRVIHPEEDGDDPVFHGLEGASSSFDGAKALASAQAVLPRGGVRQLVADHRRELALLGKALGCKDAACPVFTEPTALAGAPHDRPELTGPIDVGSTASQSFLLEYLEGKPMADVAWGRVSRADIEAMLRFHPTEYLFTSRPDYVARAAAGPLASAMLAALTQGAAKLTLFAGHDTNIADLGGFLRIHWRVPSYPADDIPPGGALGFELLRSAKGVQYVRAFFRAQTMDQVRNQVSLTGGVAPPRQYLAIPGCGDSTAATACTLAAFKRRIAARLPN